MTIASERVRAQKVLGVLQQVGAQECLITHVGFSDRFSLKRLCRVNIVTIKTDSGWSLDLVMEDDAVSFVDKVVGPDGITYTTKMAVYDWLEQEERASFDAELLAAITSALPK